MELRRTVVSQSELADSVGARQFELPATVFVWGRFLLRQLLVVVLNINTTTTTTIRTTGREKIVKKLRKFGGK